MEFRVEKYFNVYKGLYFRRKSYEMVGGVLLGGLDFTQRLSG